MVTFPEHLKREGVDKDMAKVMMLLADLAKPISKAFLTQRHMSNKRNVYGEKQHQLEVWADQQFINELKKSRLVRTIASEEQDNIIEVMKTEGEFGITLDPLDGSSLLGINLTVGSIIGIFNEGNVMEKGKLMDAAMYILYGPVTTLVYTAKKGVHEFFLDKDGMFHLYEENLKMPEGKIYAPGALRKDWLPWHRRFIEGLEQEGYKMRYSGALVADFHQILHKGGFYCYPSTKEKPQGKLRLLFEGNPLTLIAKEAGGGGSDGQQDVHQIKPEVLSHRIPLYIGNRSIMDRVESLDKR
ncbi:MAG: fructose-1,6-bisphosphatase [Nanoarchaeota archaeon]|nr:fructose-1,6-bisphosphatase [Nanoarchaeota archaeon]